MSIILKIEDQNCRKKNQNIRFDKIEESNLYFSINKYMISNPTYVLFLTKRNNFN